MDNFSGKRRRFRLVIPAYPAFNIYSNVANITTALGPVCIASSVNEMEGWDTEVIDENNLRQYGPKGENGGADHEFLQQLRPVDVLGLYGGLTSTAPRLYEIARFYKEKGVITVAGGQHFARENISDALHSNIDYVVMGEGEITIKELLRALEGNKDVRQVKGIAYLKDGEVVFTGPREPITDFDTLPHPDFSLVRYARIKLYPVGRIRGCGMDCEFCTVKGKPRCASPERLLEDISFLLETRDAKHFFIVDDLFGQYRDETIRFCHMLRDYQGSVGKRLDVTVQIRLDKAKDPELLSAMRQAGINTVAIGFESPIEEELKAMNKCLRPKEMLELARIFRKFGFLVHGMFI
ncbi:MAG: radical SAM protein, partial [Candidatus Omnitrophica bacterium]|nr:radical SAM protein [Candidatus Omnitrophota bacterium]